MGDVGTNEEGENPMVRTISSCERELEDIQGILEDLSTEIKTKIDEKEENISKNSKTPVNKFSIFTSSELNSLLDCTEDEFELQTSRMSVTDLDLTQKLMQAEMLVLQQYLQQHHGLDQTENDSLKEKVVILQDRLYRCMTKRGQNLGESNLNERTGACGCDDNSKEDDRKANILRKDVEHLSFPDLESLLRHNSVDFDENTTNRDYLLQLAVDKLIPESWQPPDQDSLKWQDASSLKRNTVKKFDVPPQPTSPTDSMCDATPVESYFILNPSDMDNYLHYKAVNDEKLVDWDPTLLLKELYGKITVGCRTLERTSSKSKRVSCIQGYLDKLPMNQTKSKAFKGWKKRFFQISRGKLYYYENHKSETPFGHIDILGSVVESGDHNTIIINARHKTGHQKNAVGNKLILRCGTEAELNDWLTTLKRTATIEPVPGTLTREGSLKKRTKKSNHPIIIDMGACTVRAGLSTDTTPVMAFPAAFAVKAESSRNGRRFTESGLPDPHSCRCGFEAFYPQIRKDAKIVYPLRPSLRIDKYSIKVRYIPGFLEKVFRDLEVDSNDKIVIISHSSHLSNKDKEFVLDYLFGQMNVGAVYMQNQSLLSLYSYSTTTGLIVDLGDHVDILPVIEGNVIEKGKLNLPFSGQQITENFGKLLTESGYRLFTDIESYIVRYVKEKVCEASKDFQEDMTSTPNPVNVDIERFKLPDGKKIIQVGNMKYSCVEGLFNPGLWGKDVSPLQSMIERSIKACDIDQRRELCKNIYLSGGTSMFEGLCARLEEEIISLFPESMNIKVNAGSHRLNAAYKGAIVVAGLSNFHDLLIKKNEWNVDQAESLFERWRS